MLDDLSVSHAQNGRAVDHHRFARRLHVVERGSGMRPFPITAGHRIAVRTKERKVL